MSGISGVLPVDKPVGPTSHDAVGIARRALGTRRIGHTGTLDPFASGLLLLCLGPATRLAEYLSGLSKRYIATIRLGETTDTDDHTGEVIAGNDSWSDLSEDDVRRALRSQIGTIRQLPPVYSAKRVAGERMYAAARRGEAVVRTPVEVTIHSLAVLRVELPDVQIEVHCSSGTYIRAIARDLGEALGTGGHLAALRRTAVGEHEIASAIALDRLDDAAAVSAALLSPAAAMAHLPSVTVDADGAARIAHGGAVDLHDGAGDAIPEASTVALLDEEGGLLAIAERHADRLRPRKVFT